MKKKHKTIALALVLAAILCSFTYSRKEGAAIEAQELMRTLHYNGHRYICYRAQEYVRGGVSLGASIVHDPDCSCRKGGAKWTPR